MLYLGQICKLRLAENKVVPAIFLGFKVEGTTRKAHVLYYPDWKDKAVTTAREAEISEIGLFKVPSKVSPTGNRIFKGALSTNVINEHVKLKEPKPEMMLAAIQEVYALKLV